MVKLQEAENQIVIDFEVYDQRPSDSDLLVPAIDAHQAAVGRVLFRQERGCRKIQRRQAHLRPQPFHQESRAQTRAKKALVPQRPEMAHRM
jgi:hypothetical protein